MKISDSLEELRDATSSGMRGITITGMSGHMVSQSLYLANPDGNEVAVCGCRFGNLENTPPAALFPIKLLEPTMIA